MAIALASVPAASGGGTCLTQGRTLARSARARVFAVRGRSYACLNARGRAVRVGRQIRRGGRILLRAWKYRLAGPYVAFATSSRRRRPEDEITVKDLRSGAVRLALASGDPRHEVVPGTGTGAPSPAQGGRAGRAPNRVGVGPVLALALDQRGEVAWIVRRELPPSIEELHFAFGPHASHVIDAGAGLAPASLTLTLKTVSWLHGNHRFVDPVASLRG